MSEIQDVNERTSNAPNESEVQNGGPFLYNWPLSNFLVCLKYSDANILGQEFEFAGAKWRLQLQAICKNDKLNRIKIRLVKSERDGFDYYIKCKFSLVNGSGSSVTREAVSSFNDKSLNGHRSSFKCHQENRNALPFFIDDRLTLNCEFLVVSSYAASSTEQASLIDTTIDYISQNPISSCIVKMFCKFFSVEHLYTRPLPRNLRRKSEKAADVLTISLIFISFLFISVQIIKDYQLSVKSSVNATEVNELILDSTLKIRSIAEALNLTDVKNKSLELLAWYNEKFNVTKGIFPN